MYKLWECMDFPQFNIARTELKDLRRPALSQHVHLDVVLIDRSQQGVFPHVFQLNNENVSNLDQLDLLRQKIASFHLDAFTYLGEALQVDTDKKMITLTDDNMITYKYLIVVSSPCHARELNAFLPTLKDVLLLETLNIQAKLNQDKSKSLPAPFQKNQSASLHAKDESHTSTKLVPIAQKSIASPDVAVQTSVHPKRLCQVKT